MSQREYEGCSLPGSAFAHLAVKVRELSHAIKMGSWARLPGNLFTRHSRQVVPEVPHQSGLEVDASRELFQLQQHELPR